MPMTPALALVSFTCVALAACGGGAPAAEAPTPAPASSASTAPGPSAEPAAPTGAPAAAPASAAPAAAPATPPAPAAEPAKATRPPLVDVLTAPTVAFMINYGESGPKATAEKLCQKAGEDPGVRAACMEKERDRFLADVLVFTKSSKGLSFTVYSRQGSKLTEVSYAQIEFGAEANDSIPVKVKNEKGTRPIFAGKKELVVSAPGEYGIELNDPVLGKLVYEARIGIVEKPVE